jgi:hypothetical protein
MLARRRAENPHVATILGAQDGSVLIDKSYKIPQNPQNVPTTINIGDEKF